MYSIHVHVYRVVDSFSPADRLSASEIHLLWQSWLEVVVVICSAVIPCTCSAHPSCVTVYNYTTTCTCTCNYVVYPDSVCVASHTSMCMYMYMCVTNTIQRVSCGSLTVCSVWPQELRERVLRGKYRIPFYMSTDCENLLKKFLVLNPLKRASLEVCVCVCVCVRVCVCMCVCLVCMGGEVVVSV